LREFRFFGHEIVLAGTQLMHIAVGKTDTDWPYD
jgi:hypothetical protein